jgi:hypothetical protein
MPLTVEVADSVVAELNAATLSQTFEAQRLYRPQFDAAQLKTLRVSVVPKKIEIATASRGSNQYDVSIDVAVQKKLDSDANDAIDPLMQLVEEIGEFFRLRPLASVAAAWIKTENAPIYALEHLEQQRVFTSVLTLTFRTVR